MSDATTRPKRRAAAAQPKFERDSDSSSSSSSESEEEEKAPLRRSTRAKSSLASTSSSRSTSTTTATKRATKKPSEEPAPKRTTAKKEPSTAKKENVPMNDDEESSSEDDDDGTGFKKFAVHHCFNNLESQLDLARECERLCHYFSVDFERTKRDFAVCMNNLLLEYKTTPQILLCVELMQSAVSKQPPAYQVHILSQAVQLTKAKDRGVRLRSVNFIRYWLRAQTEILEDLHEPLVQCLLESTMDKNALVRTEAVMGLEYFQDPNDVKDKVISRLCQVCKEDPIAAVRKAGLKVLVPNELSIQTMVERTRDESSEVRSVVFRELRDRFQMEWFSPSALTVLFDQGLADPTTKEACEALLVKWYRSKKNLMSFLDAFDVAEDNENTMLRILGVLESHKALATIPANSSSELDGDTTESSLCVRYFAKAEDGDIQHFETFTRMLGEMQTELEDVDEIAFICKNLLIACAHSTGDLDRSSKDRIAKQLAQSLLVDNFPLPLVQHMMPVYRQCFASPREFVFEVVTNVLSSLSEQSPLEQVRQDLAKAQQLIETYTREKNYSALERLCAEIKTLQEREQEVLRDPNSAPPVSFSKLGRACCVAAHMFQCISRQTNSEDGDPMLASVLDMVCLPGVQSSEVETRAHAIDLLGLISLQKPQVARSHGLILATSFLDNVEEDIQVRVRAVRVIFDLLLCFGSGCTSSQDEFDALIQHLMAFLDMSYEEEIRFVAAHGLSKLLFLQRVAYPGLVQCLLIVLFHPSSSGQAVAKLKQCLTTFFAEYTNTTAVLQASEPLIQAIMFPTADSLCEDLPMDQVLDRLSFLLRPTAAATERNGGGDIIQLGFADLLLEKIAQHPTHEYVKLLVKTVVAIPISTSANVSAVRRLQYFAVLVLQLVSEDKTSSKRMMKFISQLNKLLFGNECEVADDVKQQVHGKFPAEVLREVQSQLKKQPLVVVPSAALEEEEEEDDDDEEEED